LKITDLIPVVAIFVALAGNDWRFNFYYVATMLIAGTLLAFGFRSSDVKEKKSARIVLVGYSALIALAFLLAWK
jgi:hypothetical protein